jgi:hypothetical protein
VLSATLLAGDAIELRVARPPGFFFLPGQFVWLAVDDVALGKRAYHPFAISSPPEAVEVLVFHIRVSSPTGWTAKLRALVEAREVLLRRRLEGVIDDLVKARDAAAANAPRPADEDDDGDDHGGDGVARRCGEAAARAAGETAEIAGEFRGIHRELVNNALATPDVEARLLGQIAEPLMAIVTEELATAISRCRKAGEVDAVGGRQAMAAALDAAVAKLRAVLDRMLELESINEVIERLRGVIRVQEQIRDDTLERQRRRGREALESP